LQVSFRIGSPKADRREVVISRDLGSKAGRQLVILGFIGAAGWMANFVNQIPIGAQFVFALLSELLVFAFIALFYLQLKGRVTRSQVLLNWCFFLPVILLAFLATSKMYPLVRIVVVALIVFLFARKTVPWRALGTAALVLVPVFFLKVGIRQIETASNKNKPSGASQVIEKLQLYGSVIQNLTTNLDTQIIEAGYNATANRFDLTHTFAFIIDYTPSQVPYLAGQSYQDLLWKAVPRVLYPAKPVENWGNELGHRFGWLAPDDDDTTVNLPQMIELYLNFGPVGIPLGMFAIGLIYAGLIRLLYRDRSAVQGLITIFIMSMLFNIESNFSLVFGGLFYIIPIFILVFRIALRSTLELPGSEPRPVDA